MKTKLWEFFLLNMTFIVMFFSYKFMIAPQFSYMGFKNNLNTTDLIMVYFLYNLLCLFLITLKTGFEKFVSLLLLIMVSIPNFILYSFQDFDERIVIWSFLCIPITVFILIYLPKIKTKKIREKNIPIILWSLIIICIIPVILSHGIKLNFQAFLFTDIYDIRRESRLNNSFLSVYGYFWLAKVICPISIIYAIEKGYKGLLISALVVLMYLFTTTGHKSVFLSVFIIFLLYFGGNNYNTKYKMVLLLSLLLFITIRLMSELFGFIGLESAFIRRLIFIPALLNNYYFEFFNSNFVYYSQSYLSLFLDYPYNKPIPQIIGINFFNSDEMSANNGYLSDGFANLGNSGVLINIILSSMLIKAFKDYSIQAKYSGLLFVTLYSIFGSAFSTVLFTHGGLLLAILLATIFSPKNSNENT